ncbi:MAG: glycosyltransferase family 39 protein [Thermodesulfobacteriota bacterium]
MLQIIIRSKILFAIVFLLSVVLALAGQYQFSYSRAIVSGSILYLFALVLFFVSHWLYQKARNIIENVDDDALNEPGVVIDLDLKSVQFWLLLLSFLMFAYVLFHAYKETASIFTLLVWTVSLVLFVFSFVDLRKFTIKPLKAFVNKNRYELVLIGLITVGALTLRLYKLGVTPLGVNQEEGYAGMGGLDVILGTLSNPFGFGPVTAPPIAYSALSFYGHALFINLFDVNVFNVRLFSAIAGTLNVIFTYLLAREIWGRGVGIISGILVAVAGIHIHFSRFAFPYIQNSLFGAMTLYFLVRAIKNKAPAEFALAGFSIGLAQYFWTDSRILPFIVVIFFIYKIIQKRDFLSRYYKGLTILFVSFFITFAPLALPIEKKFRYFTQAPSRTFIFGGWMATDYANRLSSGESHWHIMGEQIVRSFLSFNFYPDKGYVYGGDVYGGLNGPMLEFFTSIFFILGLSYTLFTWRKSAHLLLLIALFGAVFGLVALSNYPPNYQRMVVILSLPFIFAAVGIWKFFEYLSAIVRYRKVICVALIPLLLILGWRNYQRYFSEYLGSRYFALYTDPSTQVGHFIKSLDLSYEIYLPAPYMQLPWTVKFITEDAPYKIDYRPLPDVLQGLEANVSETVFILLPEQANNLDLLQKKFPGGITHSLSDDFPSIKVYKIE